MKNAEFVALLIANTNKTESLRTYGRKWFSGARRIPNEYLSKIGHVVALIQARIDEGLIIDKREESLLVYNMQPLQLFSNCNGGGGSSSGGDVGEKRKEEEYIYIALDMVIKPLAHIDETHCLVGKPFHLVIEGVSGEVMNNTKAMLELELITEDDLDPGDAAESYGSYKDFNAVCGYLTLHSLTPINDDKLFKGKYDKSSMVRDSVGFDCIFEAMEYLKQFEGYVYVVEVVVPKEKFPDIIAEGIHKYILKLVDSESVLITPRPEAYILESRVDDEVRYLEMARLEPDLSGEESFPNHQPANS